MKNFLLEIALYLCRFVVNNFFSKVKKTPVYTYRRGKDENEFFVGYWTNSGNFVTKAQVQDREEARELCALLNRQNSHD